MDTDHSGALPCDVPAGRRPPEALRAFVAPLTWKGCELACHEQATRCSRQRGERRMAEGVGFEPTRACALPVFPVGPLRPKGPLGPALRGRRGKTGALQSNPWLFSHLQPESDFRNRSRFSASVRLAKVST